MGRLVNAGPSGRAADLLPALTYHYSPAPRPFRPHQSIATRSGPSHPYHPPPHNPVTSGLSRSSGISLETHGRGDPTHTKQHRGRRMGRGCKGLCRSSGVSFETRGRGELSRTKGRRGMRMGRRCKGLSRSSGISLETPGRGEPPPCTNDWAVIKLRADNLMIGYLHTRMSRTGRATRYSGRFVLRVA